MDSLKELLKKTNIYYKYKLLNNKFKAKKNNKSIEKEISNKYVREIGHTINWDNPISYTEKINYSKLYNVTPDKVTLSDKYKVRSWVEKTIGEQYLIPLLGAYDSYNEIDFESLPDQFVIKCNHDSGSVTIVNDKSAINHKKLKKFYDFCIQRNYAYNTYEMQYKDITPKIIIEEKLESYSGDEINDYKFLCFDGEPHYIWIDVDRHTNHKRKIVDVNWNPQEFKQYDYQEKMVQKPDDFELMMSLVRKLCCGFDHVRVDLYNVDGRVYFGEMTFTNGSGYEKISPAEWDYKLGELWKLDTGARSDGR